MTLKRRKENFTIIVFSISLFFIFFSMEGSFLLRSIIPPIVLVVLYTIVKRQKIVLNAPMKWFLALEVIYFFSLLINSIRYNTGFSVAIQMFYQLGIFVWFVVVLQDKSFSKEELNLYINSYITVCILCSIYIIVNNLFLGRYASSITSFLGYKIGKNFFGAFICMGPLFSTLKVLYSKKNKILNMIFTIIMLIAVLFTNSRGTLLALVIGLVLIVSNYGKGKITKKQLLVILAIIIVAVLGIRPLLGLIPDWMFKRYFVNSYNDASNTDRMFRWKNAIDGIVHSPLFGYGPGVFALIPEYSVTEFGVSISDATYAHNTYLDVMVNGGLLGIICFLGIIYTTIRDAFRYNKIFRPVIVCLIITSGILGAGKSVYFWNNLIFIGMLSVYSRQNIQDNIFE